MDTHHHDTLFIGGEWVRPATAKRLIVVNPATESEIGSSPAADVADVDRAVRAAQSAIEPGAPWTRTTIVERARLLRAFADELDAFSDEIAAVNTDEGGQPLTKSKVHAAIGAKVLRYYADLGERTPIEYSMQGVDNPVVVRREPVGVAGIIVPWNSPLTITFFSLAPALLAGCSVVLKPDPHTPLHSYFLARIAERIGLPAGVLNIVPADREASESLVAHPGVDKITFTGSTAVGRRIGEICGRDLRRYSLELGGKSAAVILDDVDVDALMPRIIGCSITNNGEACVGQTRILVPRSRYDEIADAYVAGVEKLRVGDPYTQVDVGPLISAAQRDRVEGYIDIGRKEGRLLVGGGRPAGLDRGWYVEPTVFGAIDNSARIAQEEIFGPVQVLIPYDDTEDAVRIANDSPYGLSGSVWTSDPERGMEIARRVRTGNFGVNWFGLDPAAPFGGFKSSGMGRQLGEAGLQGFFELKGVQVSPFDARTLGLDGVAL
jgi:betaine-aldehyde dehydrogenase